MYLNESRTARRGGRGRLEGDAGLLLDDVEDEVRHGPVDVGDGQEALDEAVEVLPPPRSADDEAVPIAGDIVDGGDVGVLGDPLLGLDELALGDADGDDGREAEAEKLGSTTGM